MNLIYNDYETTPFFTYIDDVFDSFNGKQNDYNWLLTDFELNDYPKEFIGNDIIWLSGEKLTSILKESKIQFIWAVLSGFKKDITINPKNLSITPIVKDNYDLWKKPPHIQHPDADVEIICFDSSATILLSKDLELSRRFFEKFNTSKNFDELIKNNI